MMNKKKNKTPKKFNPHVHDAGTIHEWLLSRGIPVQGVSVSDDGIEVETEGDVDVNLDDFEPPVSEREVLMGQLNKINVDQAGIAELREAVNILKELITSEA